MEVLIKNQNKKSEQGNIIKETKISKVKVNILLKNSI